MNYILLGLMAITCLVSYQGFQDYNFFNKYKFHIGSIRAGEQVRMLTSGFLHADWMHLGFNMLTLYFFGPVVIYHLGNFMFLIIYLCSLIAGSLFGLIFHKDDYSYSAVGASGAVMGVLYSGILFEPNMSINFIPAWLFGIIYMGFSIYGMQAKRDNIGHTAHVGGAFGGYVITLVAVPQLFAESTMYVVLLAIPIVALVILSKSGRL